MRNDEIAFYFIINLAPLAYLAAIDITSLPLGPARSIHFRMTGLQSFLAFSISVLSGNTISMGETLAPITDSFSSIMAPKGDEECCSRWPGPILAFTSRVTRVPVIITVVSKDISNSWKPSGTIDMLAHTAVGDRMLWM